MALNSVHKLLLLLSNTDLLLLVAFSIILDTLLKNFLLTNPPAGYNLSECLLTALLVICISRGSLCAVSAAAAAICLGAGPDRG